jgi:anaerobic selenocysteine-containing dehydrogenase
MPKPGVAPPESTVSTACPLDCPDACTLDVTVRGGRVTKIDGSTENHVTNGYICAKVRRFHERVYGEDRLLYPAVRRGTKGAGQFKRVTWDDALELIAEKFQAARASGGAETILPLCYGGSNGFLTQDYADAILFRRFATSRLLRTVCAAPTGAANLGLYGKMSSVSYEDVPDAKMIIVWGVNPSVSGIHIMPFIKEARDKGAFIVVIDPRATPLARQADMHLAVRPGTDLPVALSIHRYLFEEGHAALAFLDEHTNGAAALREKARPWTFERAAEVSGVETAQLRTIAERYVRTSPALVKCGWGLERNRNGGSAAAAVLALPAVGGKFGVRGGGYMMSNSTAWDIERSWLADQEPPTRAINMNKVGRILTEPEGSPINVLFVYNCNPVAILPDQRRVIRGLEREDLFTVVFDQVLTDTAMYADVVLPATTFLEHYDFARGYGPITLQLGKPVIDAVGESRSNTDVFMDLARRLDLGVDGDPADELEAMLGVLGELPQKVGDDLRDRWKAEPPHGGRPVQFVDVFPKTADRKVNLFPADLDTQAPIGLYGYQPDPATTEFPLAMISPASERTISSTLGELSRPEVRLEMNPDDAGTRGIREGDAIRAWNALGEMRINASLSWLIKRGTVAVPKGVWRRNTKNGYTSNAMVPDSLSDLGGGACFNDARIQVERTAAQEVKREV